MCTKLDGNKVQNVTGYKVVTQRDYQNKTRICSPMSIYFWEKGVNTAYAMYYDVAELLGLRYPIRPDFSAGKATLLQSMQKLQKASSNKLQMAAEDKRMVSGGAFHFCPTLEQAVVLCKELPEICMILPVTLENAFTGIHANIGGEIDDQPAYVATEAHWDGETIYTENGKKKSIKEGDL